MWCGRERVSKFILNSAQYQVRLLHLFRTDLIARHVSKCRSLSLSCRTKLFWNIKTPLRFTHASKAGTEQKITISNAPHPSRYMTDAENFPFVRIAFRCQIDSGRTYLSSPSSDSQSFLSQIFILLQMFYLYSWKTERYAWFDEYISSP